MKKWLGLCILCIFNLYTTAQFSKYIVVLKNKNGNPFSITAPERFLSTRSITRRTRQRISIDETDLPVVPKYIDSIRQAGNVTILNVSKWLNQVCIYTTDQQALNKINNFSFVINTQPLRRPIRIPELNNKFDPPITPFLLSAPKKVMGDYYDYGNSYNQIHIHEGEFLHNSGFHGEGMMMAIIDAGFFHYLSNPAFDSIRNKNQIIETYDFVNNKISVNEEHSHGMNCLSIIAANWPGQLIGSCPKASYYLYKSEDVNSEYPVEEQNWVAAAERADSIGVDVISTSLGYTTFDNPIFDHTHGQMNGISSIIAKGNMLASKKGIISVVAAGNDGNKTWHYISTPADADNILTVGAVNAIGISSGFSSYGPSSDGRVKPDVASVGEGTAISSTSNIVSFGNGTSFSTPNIAGLTTCLWQAFQDFTNLEIIDVIKKSSSIYTMPDNRIGYGIPNYHTAYNILTRMRNERISLILVNDWIKVFPNPFKGDLHVIIKPKKTGVATITVYDTNGKLYVNKQINVQQEVTQNILFEKLNIMSKGIYTLEYNDFSNRRSIKIIRQ